MVVVPVFVSSTFRDFHGERDVIRSLVSPELDHLLAPYGARVELLDLRWGVDTSDVPNEVSAQQQVLDVCMGEIDRCRPLFLGLLGDRVGWVPQPGRLADAVARSGAGLGLPSDSAVRLSLTGLEFWHGVLAPGAASEAVIAVRRLRGQYPRGWADTDRRGIRWLLSKVDAAAAADPERVRVFRYDGNVLANDDCGRPEVQRSALETFAEQVVALLGPPVVGRAITLTQSTTTPYAAGASLAVQARKIIVGRDQEMERVAELLAGNSRGVVLSGPSGAGKTTVWLAACERAARDGFKVARVIVGAGPGSTSARDVIGLLAAQLGLQLPDEGPFRSKSDPDAHLQEDNSSSVQVRSEDLLGWWASALAGPGRTLIAVDGLDRLDPGEARDNLELLQGAAAGKLRFLTTTTLRDHVRVLTARRMVELPIGELAGPAARAAAVAWAAEDGHRQLPASVLEVIARRPRSGLWIRLAVLELSWLGGADLAGADAASAKGLDPARALSAVLAGFVEKLPDDDVELAARVLARAAAEIGDMTAAGLFLGCLAITRSGLAPADLQVVSGIADDLRATRARRLLGGQVSARDETGRLALDHPVLRDAALRMHLSRPDETDVRALHARLAAHFGGLAGVCRDEVAASDWIWHALFSGDARTVVDALVGREDPKMDSLRAADVIAQALLADRGPHSTVREALAGVGKLVVPTSSLLDLMGPIGDCVIGYGETDLTIEERSILGEVFLALSRRWVEIEPTDPTAVRNLVMCLWNLGEVALARGDTAAAWSAYGESRDLAMRFYLAHPRNSRAARRAAQSLNRVGGVARIRGDLTGAVAAHRRSALVLREITAEIEVIDEHAESNLMTLSTALNALGHVEMLMGDQSAARESFSEALRIRLSHAARHPLDADAQRSVAVALENVGRVETALGYRESAHSTHMESLKIRRRLAAADPGDMRAARDLMLCLCDVGDLAKHAGDLEVARAAYAEGLQISRRRIEFDPRNAEANRDLTLCLCRTGDVALASSDLPTARVAYDELLSLSQKLATSDQTNAEAQRDLAVAWSRVGDIARARGELVPARAAYQEFLDLSKKLAALDINSAQAAHGVMVALLRLAELALKTDDPGSARVRQAWAQFAAQVQEMDSRGWAGPDLRELAAGALEIASDPRLPTAAPAGASRIPPEPRTGLDDLIDGFTSADTWQHAFEILAANTDILTSQAAIRAMRLRAAKGDAQTFHAILDLAGHGFGLADLQECVCNPAAADRACMAALFAGEPRRAGVILLANPALARRAKGQAIWLTAALMAGADESIHAQTAQLAASSEQVRSAVLAEIRSMKALRWPRRSRPDFDRLICQIAQR